MLRDIQKGLGNAALIGDELFIWGNGIKGVSVSINDTFACDKRTRDWQTLILLGFEQWIWLEVDDVWLKLMKLIGILTTFKVIL